jgi:hypothetical protein
LARPNRGTERTNDEREPVVGRQAARSAVEERISELNDWRGETIARVRNLIKQADPEVVKTRKLREGRR